ncbi:uncharacterized protein LOC101745081 isoform X1 [Bombyx mori]|uniref:Trissin n=1 Tax=Bombyx mori TaxID=7091 RepID=A0A8R2G9P7_BOMMO|nr:uncharacterized protein LOC101745081 isoform X1 [Bombyx mori]
MFKITAILSLMLIATWSQAASRRFKKDATASDDFDAGTTLWAASLSCDSCGNECTSACGTRHFRSCCFNYLRRKRGPESVKIWTPSARDNNLDSITRPRYPFFVVQNLPEQWLANLPSDYKPYDDLDTRQSYDA